MSDDVAEVKELNGQSQFPEDVVVVEKTPTAPIEAPTLKPRNLTAYELSSYAKKPGDPVFGMDRKKVAATLRDMADRFEGGEYLIQETSVLSRAEHDEYAMTYVTLVFHQRIEMTANQLAEKKREYEQSEQERTKE